MKNLKNIFNTLIYNYISPSPQRPKKKKKDKTRKKIEKNENYLNHVLHFPVSKDSLSRKPSASVKPIVSQPFLKSPKSSV
jgi:hypothetical protein